MRNELVENMSIEVTRLCEQAAACIRAVNHLTFPDGCEATLCHPSDAYQALSALGLLIERLPQALHQIARWFGRKVNDGEVVIDRGTPYEGDPERAASDLWTYVMNDATPALDAVAAALDRTRQTLAHAALREADGATA
jgi:hypothetical protein